MAGVEELIRAEQGGAISFGNHKLSEKAKLEDFECSGSLYKVKTYKKMTKLEKNGMFVYESVPGTSISCFGETKEEVAFFVEGDEDAQITVGLEEDAEYDVFIGGEDCGTMKTGLGGKLSVSAELAGAGEVQVKFIRI